MVSRFGINQNEDAIFIGRISLKGEICLFVRPLDEENNYSRYRVLFFKDFIAEPQIIAHQQDVRSICAFRNEDASPSSFAVAGEDGRLTFVGSETIVETVPKGLLENNGIEFDPSIHSMCITDGQIFLCGSAGLFLSRKTPSEWAIPDLPLMRHGEDIAIEWISMLRDPAFPTDRKRELMREKDSLQLYAIGGPEKDDLYLCGIAGTMLHWNGAKATALKRVTDKHLTHVFTENQEKIWLFGLRGGLLRGNSSSGFKYISSFDDTHTIRSMAHFDDKLYILTLTRRKSALYLYTNDEVKEVFIKDIGLIGQAHTLDTDQSSMWLIGLKGILRFDGKSWERIFLVDS